jgi:hypothetical protein
VAAPHHAQQLVAGGVGGTPQHVFDFTGASVADAGMLNTWTVATGGRRRTTRGGLDFNSTAQVAGSTSSIVITPAATVSGTAMSFSITATYSSHTDTRTVFNLDGFEFRINPSAIDVGVQVSVPVAAVQRHGRAADHAAASPPPGAPARLRQEEVKAVARGSDQSFHRA